VRYKSSKQLNLTREERDTTSGSFTLNNIDKHRLLVTVASSFKSVNLGACASELMRQVLGDHIPVIDVHTKDADNLCPLEAGDELFIDAADTKMHKKMDCRFNIALNEPEIVDGKPLLQTIQHLADLVAGMVAGFRPFLLHPREAAEMLGLHNT
jgi:hypothetical protein